MLAGGRVGRAHAGGTGPRAGGGRGGGASGELPRTTFQGMPPLHGGLFTDTPGAGELFPQPTVQVGAGPPTRLDDVLPDGVVVLTTTSPAPGPDLGAAVIEVAPAGATPSDSRVRSGSVLPDWFAHHDARFAVVRPDRYVHATADTVEATAALTRRIAAHTASGDRGVGQV